MHRPNMTRIIFSAALVVMTLGVGVTAAQAADPATIERAELLASEGETLFNAGNPRGAIKKYLKSNRLVETSAVAYNIAYIYETVLFKNSLARDFYGRVIRSSNATPELVELALKRIQVVELKLKKEEADKVAAREAAATAAAAAAAKRGGEQETNIAPIVVIATGGAMMLGGTITGIMTLDKESKFNDEVDNQARAALFSDGETLGTITDVLLIGGGVVLTSGIIWWFLDQDEVETAASTDVVDVQFHPAVGPDAVMMTAFGRF